MMFGPHRTGSVQFNSIRGGRNHRPRSRGYPTRLLDAAAGMTSMWAMAGMPEMTALRISLIDMLATQPL